METMKLDRNELNQFQNLGGGACAIVCTLWTLKMCKNKLEKMLKIIESLC